jgi:hypothetical protein
MGSFNHYFISLVDNKSSLINLSIEYLQDISDHNNNVQTFNEDSITFSLPYE